jgi:5-methyltetrahydrofolate corrinoid/iron sulfur protein methyltransferase
MGTPAHQLYLERSSQVIALTVGKGGLPADAEERSGIAAEIMARAMEYGVPLEDIYLDPLVLQLATTQDQALHVIKTIRMFQELNDPPMKTVVGLSNISNGCPKTVRPIIDRYYLALLMYEGLTAAIADPVEVREAVKTVDAIMNKTLYAHSYLEM